MTSEATAPQPWTREARDYTLAGISVVRAFKHEKQGGVVTVGQTQTLAAFEEAVHRLGGGNNLEGTAVLASGLTRLADMLLDWIQNEADAKQALLQDIRLQLPDYEEPDTYRTDPQWSTWDGVLQAIEGSVRVSPTAG